MGKLTYTTQEAQDRLDAVGTLVRPNLLDNAYFVGGGSQQGGGQFPINTRGQTSYAGAVNGIDRWKGSNQYVVLTVRNDCVNLSSSNNSNSVWLQNWSDNNAVYGKTMTVSVLLLDGTLLSETGTLPTTAVSTNTGFNTESHNGANVGCYKNSSGKWFVQLAQIMSAQYTTSVVAVKLELGDTQTLAHQENGVWVLNEIPNYQQELEKCQRYQLELVPPGNSAIGCIGGGTPTSTTQCYVFVPTPTELRTVPALTYAGTWKLVSEGTAPSSGASVSAMSVVNRSTNGVTLQITSSGLSTSYRYDLWYTAADTTNKLLLSANL